MSAMGRKQTLAGDAITPTTFDHFRHGDWSDLKGSAGLQEMLSAMNPPKMLTVDYQQGAKFVVADEMHGGMGTVFKLFPVAPESPIVAMKTIRGNSSIVAFDIECEAWISVADHPNIARPLAFGTWESLPSVLIEWYPLSLDQLPPESLDVGAIQQRIAETVAALKFAFDEKRLIHQDIKPANILIDESGKVRLSDFGLARSMVPNFEERLQMGVGGVPKSSSKELSGTPFFMAPELWSGTTPTVRTDIFSLGVTYYKWLTGKHPYAAAELADDTPELLLEPLRASIPSKGEERREIIAFLERCLKINPDFRYQSYDEMLADWSWLRLHQQTSSWTTKRSEMVAATGQFLQTRGDTAKAILFLKQAVERRPDDIVLIESLAKAYAAAGEMNEAELNFSLCYNKLKLSNGRHDGIFFPGPALSWSEHRIRSGRFEEAASVISEVLGWRTDSFKDPNELVGSDVYAEIGWFFLYKGEFARAARELLTYASRYSINKLESIWAVEAAFLSGAITSQADELAIKVLGNRAELIPEAGEVAFVWAQMLLREYTNTMLGSELWESLPSFMFAEAGKLEAINQLPAGSLLMPNELPQQKALLLAIDSYSTGGLHDEHIRSLSKV